MSELDDQFKEFINEAIDISFNNNIEMKIFLKEWLQGMYSQATKADEYEAKAKAFDAVLKAYDEAFAIEHAAREVSNIIENTKAVSRNEYQ